MSGSIPRGEQVGVLDLTAAHRRIWEARAQPHLKVRSNDAHTLYAYGIARALVDLHPDSDPEVVLPAVLLHDTRGGRRSPGTRSCRRSPREAAAPTWSCGTRRRAPSSPPRCWPRSARTPHARPASSRSWTATTRAARALHLDDALMKDAGGALGVRPHGVDTVMDWFGLTRGEAHRLIASRVHDHLLTDAGRTMARVLAAVASVDVTPERIALG